MIYAKTIFTFLTIASVSAFAPRVMTSGKPQSPLSVQQRSTPIYQKSTHVLSLSDQPMDNLMEKAEEATNFLVVDVQKAQDELAKNWGWVTASGITTMILGSIFLYLPISATGVAYDTTVIALGATGLINVASALIRENGHKAKSALGGAGYMGLAYYMATNPGAGLNFITLSMAAVLAAEGIYEASLSVKNKDLEGRPWHLVSGLGAIAASAFLTLNIPASSLFAPGAALGWRLTSNGATKVAVGLAGKDLAKQKKNAN